jgi:hypothetical protein
VNQTPAGVPSQRVECSFFSATLCCSLNNLSDSRWPPKSLRRREGHANRGLKSWIQKQRRKPPISGEFSGFTFDTLIMLSDCKNFVITRPEFPALEHPDARR